MSKYWAHNENEQGLPHLLKDHLRCVGELAERFAAAANQDLAIVARWAGLLHDLGKYRDEFQEYLCGKRESSHETHHAVYGAAYAFDQKWLALSFAIAGHHAGLHDLNQMRDLINDPKYQASDRLYLLKERYEQELGKITEKLAEPEFARGNKFSAEFYVRMLFSALVDADFLDTEAHFSGERLIRLLQADKLMKQLLAEKARKPATGELNELRNRIFQDCLDAASRDKGFFSLTVPTGGGKTLSAMAFALRHAQEHRLQRIIVVIPFLSIIEQNANVYRRIFDPDNLGIVIEHHSAFEPPETEELRDEKARRSPLIYAAENWDAPIIITTAVQFIESLFANRPARCRKLHNVANSVVIFDEVQTLPLHLLNPLLNVLRELRDHYGTSFVFSTATQPAFRHRPRHLDEGLKAGELHEICADTENTFRKLQRVSYQFPKGKTSWKELATMLARCEQVLCVVNIRRHAKELWEAVRNQLFPGDDNASVFHLSSAMCAQHRFDLLGDVRAPAPDSIRGRLQNNLPCRVISTQLIEAGVDVDFPIVYRALAPLDAIVQAAGRCNREGNLLDETSQPIFGEVIVFRPEDHSLPQGAYSSAADIAATMLNQISPNQLANDYLVFARYFDQLFQLVPTDSEIQAEREQLHFREVAKKARVIDDAGQPVIVGYGRSKSLVDEIRRRESMKNQPRVNRADLRKLQRYLVNVRERDFLQLRALGQLQELLPNLSIYVLSEGLYHDQLGLVLNNRPLEDFNL